MDANRVNLVQKTNLVRTWSELGLRPGSKPGLRTWSEAASPVGSADQVRQVRLIEGAANLVWKSELS